MQDRTILDQATRTQTDAAAQRLALGAQPFAPVFSVPVKTPLLVLGAFSMAALGCSFPGLSRDTDAAATSQNADYALTNDESEQESEQAQTQAQTQVTTQAEVNAKTPVVGDETAPLEANASDGIVDALAASYAADMAALAEMQRAQRTAAAEVVGEQPAPKVRAKPIAPSPVARAPKTDTGNPPPPAEHGSHANNSSAQKQSSTKPTTKSTTTPTTTPSTTPTHEGTNAGHPTNAPSSEEPTAGHGNGDGHNGNAEESDTTAANGEHTATGDHESETGADTNTDTNADTKPGTTDAGSAAHATTIVETKNSPAHGAKAAATNGTTNGTTNTNTRSNKSATGEAAPASPLVARVNGGLELPPPPTPVPTEPQELARLLAESLAKQGSESSQPMREWFAFAALAIANPGLELPENFGSDLLPSERERITKAHAGFVALGNALRDGNCDVDRAVSESLIAALTGGPKLTIPKVDLCTRVESFGRYTPLANHKFLARANTRFIVYTELDGFSSEYTDGNHVTRLATRVSIESERDGIEVWQRTPEWTAVVDTSDVRREEFFLCEIIPVSEYLSVGSYRLKIEVRDEVTGTVAVSTLPIHIVADPAMAAVPE